MAHFNFLTKMKTDDFISQCKRHIPFKPNPEIYILLLDLNFFHAFYFYLLCFTCLPPYLELLSVVVTDNCLQLITIKWKSLLFWLLLPNRRFLFRQCSVLGRSCWRHPPFRTLAVPDERVAGKFRSGLRRWLSVRGPRRRREVRACRIRFLWRREKQEINLNSNFCCFASFLKERK